MPPTSDSRAMYKRLAAFGIFFLLLGAVGYGAIKVGESRIDDVARWPSVTGLITTSEVTKALTKTGRTWQFTPVANIRYSYSVNGVRYEGDGLRVVPMLHFSPEGTPEELVARYPVGLPVDVFYDSSNPRDALLIKEAAADARKLVRMLVLLTPCIGFLGLAMAVSGVLALRSENLAAPAVEASATSVAALPEAPSRATHWLIRSVATIFGLFLLLFGSLLTTSAARMSMPSVSTAVHIITLVIFGGVTLFGAILIWLGMRRPRI